MGLAIERVLEMRGHAIAGRVGRTSPLSRVQPDEIDCAFEFTSPSAAPALVNDLLDLGIATVSGTTGWDVERASAHARERKVPFLHAPNFSIGVAVLRRAVTAAAAALARFPEYEPGILERHHSAKKDAPSGTALALSRAVHTGGDPSRAVPIVSLRQGGQPGEHLIVFDGPEESVEFVHRARSRTLFAAGAVRAGEWLIASGPKGPASFDDFFDDGRK